MFRPLTASAPCLKRTTNRASRCALYVDPFDLRMAELEGQNLLARLDEQIEQRERVIRFLEDQVRLWSQLPSSSTWSEPQRDND